MSFESQRQMNEVDSDTNAEWHPDYSGSAAAQRWREELEAQRRQPLLRNSDGTYTVQRGDTLETIAERLLKESGEVAGRNAIDSAVDRLIALNRGAHSSLAENEDLLRKGWKLRLDDCLAKNNSSTGQDNVSIPALIRGQEAREGGTITVAKDSRLAALYQRVSPSVTQIIATRPGAVPGTTDASYGSGFVVGSDGLIATNNHTFYGFQNIQVITADGKKYTATVADQDPANDVGLLKITPRSGERFQALELEPDSKKIAMQQELAAFGHPGGWGKTYLSEGTVRGVTTISKVAKPEPPEENPNKQVIAIQAHGEDGGSGGPVVNESGKVAGLAELASDSQRGQHIFMTPVQHLNNLIAKYRSRYDRDGRQK